MRGTAELAGLLHRRKNQLNWSARQDLHLRSLGPKPSMLLLHYALMADPKGIAPLTLPQTTGRSAD